MQQRATRRDASSAIEAENRALSTLLERLPLPRMHRRLRNTNHAQTPHIRLPRCVLQVSLLPQAVHASAGGRGLRPSAAELHSRGGVPSIRVHHLGSAPYYPTTSVRGSGNLSKGTRSASRPAARQPATSIVRRLCWRQTQPSRVRFAGLRPPLIAAFWGVRTLPHTGTYGRVDKSSPICAWVAVQLPSSFRASSLVEPACVV